MSDNIKMNYLLDHYGSLLTDRQKDVMELHYGEDLSLAEIAGELKISRQAVHDSIQRGEVKLNELEEKLGFVKLHEKVQKTIEKSRSAIASIDENDKISREKLNEIVEWLNQIDMDR